MAWDSFAALGAVTSLRLTSGTTTRCSTWSSPAPSQTQKSSTSASQSWWSVRGGEGKVSMMGRRVDGEEEQVREQKPMFWGLHLFSWD